jgi:uncharacterized membrane protein
VEDIIKNIASTAALAIEGAAAVLIIISAAKTFYRCLLLLAVKNESMMDKRHVWLHFGRWLVLGLEFELAADILRTAVAPTWSELGQLATVAAIRTALNYFLERDMEKIAENDMQKQRASADKLAQRLSEAA